MGRTGTAQRRAESGRTPHSTRQRSLYLVLVFDLSSETGFTWRPCQAGTDFGNITYRDMTRAGIPAAGIVALTSATHFIEATHRRATGCVLRRYSPSTRTRRPPPPPPPTSPLLDDARLGRSRGAAAPCLLSKAPASRACILGLRTGQAVHLPLRLEQTSAALRAQGLLLLQHR